jgi:hypothetical protein
MTTFDDLDGLLIPREIMLDVENYKLNGYDELIQRCEQKKYKHKRVTIIKPSENNNCMI